MNNSGETTTYKFSGYTSQFRIGSSGNSIIPTYLTPDKALGIYDFVVGESNYISSNEGNNAVVGGKNNRITANSYSLVSGGLNNAVSGYYSALIGGLNNSLNGNYSITFGGFSNVISNSTNAFIIGGNNNTYAGTNEGGGCGIIGGTTNTLSNIAGYGLTILGGYNNRYKNGTNLGGNLSYSFGTILGGSTNKIENTTANTNGANAFPLILGGLSNTISGNDTNPSSGVSIINSFSSTITSSSGSTILGGNNNTISGKTDVVMLGTSGRTATRSTSTFVENIHIYRTPSTEVQPISSGTTFTCNLDNGAKAQFYLTGSSTINITNVRDGQSFMIKTQTNGNYTTTWSSTGYTFYFRDEIRNPGNNTIDIWTFEVFGNVIYGSRGHNYSIQL
jgi:hypothetical protein